MRALPAGKALAALAFLLGVALPRLPTWGEPAGYTNHAGVVIAAMPVRIEARHVTLSNAVETVRCPLSVFPEAERRRIAADLALRAGDASVLLIPADVRRALEGHAKAIRRNRLRVAKGLCSEEESKAQEERSRTARKAYLDRQVSEGRISEAERAALE